MNENQGRIPMQAVSRPGVVSATPRGGVHISDASARIGTSAGWTPRWLYVLRPVPCPPFPVWAARVLGGQAQRVAAHCGGA